MHHNSAFPRLKVYSSDQGVGVFVYFLSQTLIRGIFDEPSSEITGLEILAKHVKKV